VINGLKLLADFKTEMNSIVPDVILYCVINRNNFQTIDAMVDLAHTAGCDGLFFSPMHNFRQALSSVMLSADEEQVVRSSLSLARRRLESLSMCHNIDLALLRFETGDAVWNKLPCYVLWFHARIRTDGVVQPCGRCNADIDFGNVFASRFRDIWNGPAIRARRRETLIHKGAGSVGKHCDCAHCYFIGDITRVHRFFRWISPLVGLSESAKMLT